MEPNYQNGEVLLRKVIEAGGEWSVSPDSKLIFACRYSKRSSFVGECFDMETGESTWTFEKRLEILDVRFSPDGSQVVILHTLPSTPAVVTPPADNDPESLKNYREALGNSTPATPAAVSWYDAKSGEMTRRVHVPGSGPRTDGAVSDYLAFSGDRLYVARPCENSTNECLVIKAGAAEAEKIDVGPISKDKYPCVRVGGLHDEFVVFHSGSHAVLFRQETDGALTKLDDLTLEDTPSGDSYSWTARFTPDGGGLVLSSCLKTIHVSTRQSQEGERKGFPSGSHLADFSENGDYLVTFDKGGGRVRRASSGDLIESFDTKIHPPHCCPVAEAGFSFTGDYIVSSDEMRLLLWSKDGEELAELYSPRSDANGAVRMQSPVILEEQGKIYAADGYDFLMWDLESLHKRLSRKPDNIPRLRGEVVFNDRIRGNTEPETMNIQIDATGGNIITATGGTLRYRPLATSDPVKVPVPKGDFYMRPRMLMPGTTTSTLIVRAASRLYRLDLTGKETSVKLGKDVFGADSANARMFGIPFNGGPKEIWSYPLGKGQAPGQAGADKVVTLPADWELSTTNPSAILSSDGKWIVAIPTIWGKGSVVAVIDVTGRRIVRSMPVKWVATSLSLSDDGKRLLVGSSNRCVYQFDFLKMTGGN